MAERLETAVIAEVVWVQRWFFRISVTVGYLEGIRGFTRGWGQVDDVHHRRSEG